MIKNPIFEEQITIYSNIYSTPLKFKNLNRKKILLLSKNKFQWLKETIKILQLH
jgi:hypothetical protein